MPIQSGLKVNVAVDFVAQCAHSQLQDLTSPHEFLIGAT